MAGWNGAGSKTGAIVGGAAVAAGLALVVLYLLPGQDIAPAPDAAPEVATALQALDPAPKVAPSADGAVSAAPAPIFDLVRVEKDGSALIAGKAVPNSGVSVLVDADVVSSVVANGAGEFAALFDLAPSPRPRLITLRMRLPDGQEVVSQEQVILSPEDVAAPPAEMAANSTPDAVPDPTAQTTAVAPLAQTPAPQSDVQPEAPAPKQQTEDVAGLAAVLVGPLGVKVLQSAGNGPPDALRAVTIDAISYTALGAVQLGGRATAGAMVRLYLNDAFLTDFRVGADGGWGGVLADVTPGIYTLRADQLGADGKVTARFETPFQREKPETLAAVVTPAVAPPANPAGLPPQGVPEPGLVPENLAPADLPVEQAPVLGQTDGQQTAPNAALQGLPGEAPQITAPQMTAPPLAKSVGLGASGVAPATPAIDTAALSPAMPDATPETSPQTTASPAPQALVSRPVSVTVQPGFTLWAIARDQFGDGVQYVKVYEANKDRIRDPDLIYPGQVFALPSPSSDPTR